MIDTSTVQASSPGVSPTLTAPPGEQQALISGKGDSGQLQPWGLCKQAGGVLWQSPLGPLGTAAWLWQHRVLGAGYGLGSCMLEKRK